MRCPLCNSKRLYTLQMDVTRRSQRIQVDDPGEWEAVWIAIPGAIGAVLRHLEIECGCGFRADESFFNPQVLHPTPKRDEGGWYITFNGVPSTTRLFDPLTIKCYINTSRDEGKNYLALLRVVHAETIEELPEDLVNADEAVRMFAKKRLETLKGRKES